MLHFYFSSRRTTKRKGDKKSFHFQNIWVRHEGCEEVVKECWSNRVVSNFKELSEGMQKCGDMLLIWNIEAFGNIGSEIRKKEIELGRLIAKVDRLHDTNAIMNCRRDLEELRQREEIMWKQRARTTWLKERDRNTSYFMGWHLEGEETTRY